jgi:hypothetical protein
MIISKQELKQLVKEELTRVLKEVNGSDSLNIISLEPDEWKSEPELGVGKMKAEYDGETYEFYTVLTADEKDVQIYLLDYSAMGGTHFASRIRHRLVRFPEEQEQQIIAKMTSPEWKEAMAKVVAWSYEDPYIKEELTRVLKEAGFGLFDKGTMSMKPQQMTLGLRDSVDSIAMDVFNKINLELESIEEIQQVIDEPVVLQIIADALITAGALDDNIVDLVPEVQNALEKLFIIQMEQMKGSL